MTEPSTNQMLQIHEHEAEGMVEFFFDLADQIRSPSGRQGALFLDLIANEIQTRLDDGWRSARGEPLERLDLEFVTTPGPDTWLVDFVMIPVLA
ncbi:MAG: hypothetical protein ABIQ73_06555 [Acidimicrobiales bacterium]